MTRRRVGGLVALVVGLGAAGAWGWVATRPGWVELTVAGPPLVVQVLPEFSDEPLGPPVDVVTRATLTLPPGEYRLRVHGKGRLGRTWRLAVHRGESASYLLSLDEGRLLGREPVDPPEGGQPPPEEPIPFAPTTVAVALQPGRADFIERTDRSLTRRDATTGQALWGVDLPPRVGPAGPDLWLALLAAWPSNTPDPDLVVPGGDLSGDGTADLVYALRDAGALLAISGGDGTVLWNYSATLDGPGGYRAAGPDLGPGSTATVLGLPSTPSTRVRQVIGARAAPDLDGDGVADLVATLIFGETNAEVAERAGAAPRPEGGSPPAGSANPRYRRQVVAVSGRTGGALWFRVVDPAFSTRPSPDWQRPAVIVVGRDGPLVALEDVDQWSAWDGRTGAPRFGPIDLGFDPVAPVQHADLDGDGVPEVLALGPGPTAPLLALKGVAAVTGRSLWTVSIPVNEFQQASNAPSATAWPLVVDLDGDGRPEVAVPDAGPLPPGPDYRGMRLLDGATGQVRWTRPMRPQTWARDGLVQMIAAPDLDGDGCRDLVATSLFEGRRIGPFQEALPPVPRRVFVDALSGRTGQPLWFWHRDLPVDVFVGVQRLHWWGRGPDGWPLLAVGLDGQNRVGGFPNGRRVPPIVHNLAASTGRDVATVMGLGQPGAADLDGDGLLDLWGEAAGQLQAFRGEAPELWRALDPFRSAEPTRRPDRFDPPGSPPADLDGDGTGDVLTADFIVPGYDPHDPLFSRVLEPPLAQGFPSGGAPALPAPRGRTVVARSGRDGHRLWATALDASWFGPTEAGDLSVTLAVHPLPEGDLDGDGTPDVVVLVVRGYTPYAWGERHAATLPLRALSGRTGRVLWAAGPLPLGFRAFGDSTVVGVRPVVVHPGAEPDLLVVHASPFRPDDPRAANSEAAQPRLARVAGRTGAIRWDVPLGDGRLAADRLAAAHLAVGDLDGDGRREAVVLVPADDPSAPGTGGSDVRAIDLSAGRPLWSRHLDCQVVALDPTQLTVADLDADGRAEVLVTSQPSRVATAFNPPTPVPGSTFTVQALDGRTGQARWTYAVDPGGEEAALQGWIWRADRDDEGRPRISLALGSDAATRSDPQRLLVLDGQGRVRAERAIDYKPEDPGRTTAITPPQAVDLDGDGRAEVVLLTADRLHVWGPDLRDLGSRPLDLALFERLIPGPPGSPAALLLTTPGPVGDWGAGSPLGAGPALRSWLGTSRAQLLDPGGPDRPPLLLSRDPTGTTCRPALALSPTGTVEPTRGALVPPGRARPDPRWLRPLPWVELARRTEVRALVIPTLTLALVNVGLPWLLLRLVAGRRWRSLRVVLALPVAAAIPLVAFVLLEPSFAVPPSPGPSSFWVLELLSTLVGLLVVGGVSLVGWALIRRRWRTLSGLGAALTLLTLAAGAAWIAWDRQDMPAIEQYDGSPWLGAVALGALVVAVALAGVSLVGLRRSARPREPGVGSLG